MNKITDLPKPTQELIQKLRIEVRIERARRSGAVAKIDVLQAEINELRAELDLARLKARSR
jgi:hypothetical protein